MPPHRYLTNGASNAPRALLAARKLSVTEIGLDVGFSETSLIYIRVSTARFPQRVFLLHLALRCGNVRVGS
jgi:AraC-like DNA-binding protein